jgi:hypothetical protein
VSGLRTLLVTIDTEVDKDGTWQVSSPATFSSVLHGVPHVLGPLFARYGVVPTYFLSPEVIENAECVAVLRSLGGDAELGTHLHCEFIEPDRRLSRNNMAGQRADAIQRQYPRAIEAAKLENLTRAFEESFGRQPKAFRAGRYGVSDVTLELLASLGYRIDSSVTPGLRWKYAEGIIDFRQWSPSPVVVSTPAGDILEIPVSIRPGSRVARMFRDAPNAFQLGAKALFGSAATYKWLRPSWLSGSDLIAYVEASHEPVLNLMFHSMEIVPGASPYAATSRDVSRIVDAMDELFSYCLAKGFRFCGISDAVAV